MKVFLTSTCAKIGRIFWSWGFLKFVLWSVTLIILFYVEEDWRGARAWAATKAEWEAAGISFNPQTYVPPPIPDDQNLAALPLFKQEPADPKDSFLEPVALRKALRIDQPAIDLPSPGNLQRGGLPDMAQIQILIANDYAEIFKNTSPRPDTLGQLDALYPFLADLRAASVVRSLCRFQLDYSIQPPAGRPLGLLVEQIGVSKILTLHAILALAEHQPDLALADLKTNFNLMSGARRDPTLVAGLVGIGMNAIGNTALRDGLALHAWDDAQLAELQEELARIDFLQNYQYLMKSEAIVSIISNFDVIKTHRSLDIVGYFGQSPDSAKPFAAWITSLWANGWIDQNKVTTVTALLSLGQTVDPRLRRVFPAQADDLENRANALQQRWDGNAPWNFLFTMSAPAVGTSTSKFAVGQVTVDEMRIACALERYRLAHGVYPDSLNALAPASIDELPQDIINGEPYHYRLRPDGTFLLYSVGWNRTDDGGKVIFKSEAPMQIDYKQGDWVWPTPK
jgi:hypothetical protein